MKDFFLLLVAGLLFKNKGSNSDNVNVIVTAPDNRPVAGASEDHRFDEVAKVLLDMEKNRQAESTALTGFMSSLANRPVQIPAVVSNGVANPIVQTSTPSNIRQTSTGVSVNIPVSPTTVDGSIPVSTDQFNKDPYIPPPVAPSPAPELTGNPFGNDIAKPSVTTSVTTVTPPPVTPGISAYDSAVYIPLIPTQPAPFTIPPNLLPSGTQSVAPAAQPASTNSDDILNLQLQISRIKDDLLLAKNELVSAQSQVDSGYATIEQCSASPNGCLRDGVSDIPRIQVLIGQYQAAVNRLNNDIPVLESRLAELESQLASLNADQNSSPSPSPSPQPQPVPVIQSGQVGHGYATKGEWVGTWGGWGPDGKYDDYYIDLGVSPDSFILNYVDVTDQFGRWSSADSALYVAQFFVNGSPTLTRYATSSGVNVKAGDKIAIAISAASVNGGDLTPLQITLNTSIGSLNYTA